MKTELIHSFSSSSLTGLSRSPSQSTIGQNEPNLSNAGLGGGRGDIIGGKDEKSSSWRYRVSEGDYSPDNPDGDPGWFKSWANGAFTKKNVVRKFPVLDWFPKYTISKGISDFIAGLTVGLTLIPQGLAMASVAQIPPQVRCHIFTLCKLYKL